MFLGGKKPPIQASGTQSWKLKEEWFSDDELTHILPGSSNANYGS